MQKTQTTFDPRAARRTLMLVAAAIVSSVLAGTMTNIALPLIGRDLQIEPARLGWLVTGFLLVFGVSTPFYGRLADRWGARRLFAAGLVVFAAGSLVCTLAPSYAVLLAGRLVQAAGSGAIPGLGVALVSRAYPPERRGSAFGIVSAAVGSGAAIGPTLGGFIAGAFGWQAIYGVSVLAGLLAPLALRVIPAGGVRSREPIDILGGLLLALTVAGALLAATEASRGDLGAPLVLAAIATALLSSIALVLRQRLAAAPFVPRDLLRNRRFVALCLLSFVVMGVNLPVLVALPLMLTQFNQLPPVQIGLALMPEAVVFTLLGPLAGRIVDRVGPRLPITAGLAVMLVAVALLSILGAGAATPIVSLLAALLSAGFAFVNSPLTTAVSLVVPAERLASGLSMNSMLFFLGGAFGSALVAAVLTARGSAQNALNPLYNGQAVAFSDAFGFMVVLLIAALALTPVLPERRAATSPADTARKDEGPTKPAERPGPAARD